ncbi:MAG: type I-D CRISPR-associated protein Cas7/Csc2 [Brevinematia bacterium]|jgi:CRISPR-associated protein Csc2
MSQKSLFEKLEPYFEQELQKYRTTKTIQILMLRQTHDYSIFRTEETREINTVVLPKSISDNSPTLKVALFASKQKAPENRYFANMLKMYLKKIENQTTLNSEHLEKALSCELKDHLCRRCPRCMLFGAVSTEKSEDASSRFNIKHRIEYSTAYSLEPYEKVYELQTFNAIEDSTQLTEQALNVVETISPLVNFPSIVSLNSATKYEFIAYLKTLLALKSYGAETRTRGDTVNIVTGIVGGYEEIITPLEYNLELSDLKPTDLTQVTEKTYEILKKYREFAAFKDNVVILTPDELKQLLKEIQEFDISGIVKEMYQQSFKLYDELKDIVAGDSKKKGRKSRSSEEESEGQEENEQ